MNKISKIKGQISKKGFTLLELLVVVSIMVILLTIGLSSYSTAQKKGRDAKRKSDIREIQAAMEQYFSVCSNAYPSPDPNTGVWTDIVCTSPSIAIMPTVYLDPKTTPYACKQPVNTNCDADKYTVCTNLESESQPFCASNQQ